MADLFSGLMLAMLVLLLAESDTSELEQAKKRLAVAEAELAAAKAAASSCSAGLADAKVQIQVSRSQVKTTEDMLEQCSGPVRGLQEAVQLAKTELERQLGVGKIRETESKLGFTIDSEQLFDSGKMDVKPAGRTELRKICKAMEPVFLKHNRIQLIIEGHTDDVPLSVGHVCADNHELSWFRARAIRAQFIDFRDQLGEDKCDLLSGNERRVVAVGYGDARPLSRVAGQSDDDYRKKNRRAEFRLDKLEEAIASKPAAP
jgi:chemotaxis protein MotB